MPKRRPKAFPLVPVNLTHVMTSDGIDLAGVVVEPKGRKKAALIWLHGLTSNFEGGQKLMHQLSSACQKKRIGYFKFNNRGHHIVDWGQRHMQGAAFERFTESVRDIDAVIAYARRRGYRRFILAGHSTGANKVAYYMWKRRPRSIVGVLLAGPVSDIVGQQKEMGRRKLKAALHQARKLVHRKPDEIVPMHWGGFLSVQRFVSLYTPGAVEDTFPWHNPQARWTAVRSITPPLLVAFGGQDHFLDRPATAVVDLFRQHATSSREFSGVVIPGASHGFHRHQRQLTAAITSWLDTIV